jgi:iron-sulfur cluster repair protein YtfE (RIC family)
MLTSLRFHAPPSSAAAPDALGLMLDCHERIRRFSTLARRLGDMEGASPAELRESATQLLRSFSIGLPLHADDEDQSLTPLLLQGGLSRPLVRRLWEMGRQHEALAHQVYALAPLWAELCHAPERHPRLAGALARGGRRVAELIEEHLALEEEHLYPLARERLSAKALERLVAEMRHRRRGLLP